MAFHANLQDLVESNGDFRRVVHTGAKMQLVVMTIPVGGEIGEESHEHVEQLLVFRTGRARATLNGMVSEHGAGDALLVPPKTVHNIENIGDEPLKLFTVYAPPNHIDGRVHTTKAEADADTEDEDFGNAVLG